MCLKDNVERHWPEIERKQVTLNEALSWSATGRNLLKMCEIFIATQVMRNVRDALMNTDGNPIDRFKMSEYLALALENEPEHNMQRFVAYLDMITGRARSKRRSGYYKSVRDAVRDMAASRELKLYMAAYDQFTQDNSKEALLARDIMAEISHNTRHLIGEYA